MRLRRLRGSSDFAVCEPVATSPRARRCAADGCLTILSVYNHGRFCVLHEADEDGAARYRRCRSCGELKPATEDYWHRDRYRADGLHADCKACRSTCDRRSRERRRLSRREGADAECSRCGRTLPRTGEHWSFGTGSRLIQPCLDCIAATRERRARRTLDAYYKRKYGMTRDEYLARHGDSLRPVTVVMPNRTATMEVRK